MDVVNEKDLGKRLQAARQAANLTQQELCHKAGLSYSTLTKIERGAIKSPSIFTIQHIAEALGTSLDALMGLSTPVGRQHQTSKSGARFVYFDLNGCLVRGASSAFTSIAHDSNQPIDVIESVFWHYDEQLCSGKLAIKELEDAWFERLGIRVNWQRSYTDAVEVMPGMFELVEWVTERYYTGILSNTMPGLINSLQAAGKLPAVQFDAIVDSSAVGSMKPERQIYDAAATQADISPQEILLIDDTRSNLIAAEQLGWHTIWFDSFDPARSIENIKAALQTAAAQP